MSFAGFSLMAYYWPFHNIAIITTEPCLDGYCHWFLISVSHWTIIRHYFHTIVIYFHFIFIFSQLILRFVWCPLLTLLIYHYWLSTLAIDYATHYWYCSFSFHYYLLDYHCFSSCITLSLRATRHCFHYFRHLSFLLSYFHWLFTNIATPLLIFLRCWLRHYAIDFLAATYFHLLMLIFISTDAFIDNLRRHSRFHWPLMPHWLITPHYAIYCHITPIRHYFSCHALFHYAITPLHFQYYATPVLLSLASFSSFHHLLSFSSPFWLIICHYIDYAIVLSTLIIHYAIRHFRLSLCLRHCRRHFITGPFQTLYRFIVIIVMSFFID